MTWREKRLLRQFEKVGDGCVFPGAHMDIKGHVELGDRCTLRHNVLLRTHGEGRIHIGNGVEIGDYAMCHAEELVSIGNDSYIGPFCVMRDSLHTFYGTDVHWRRTPLKVSPIRIGNGCYIGAHCYVMPGVTIGDAAVVIPGSVVTKDVGEAEIWGGAPSAQLIGKRGEEVPPTALRKHRALLEMLGFR